MDVIPEKFVVRSKFKYKSELKVEFLEKKKNKKKHKENVENFVKTNLIDRLSRHLTKR